MTTSANATTAPTPQVRFPGQAAAPEGPVDVYMMYTMHHAFRRDLGDFATAVPRTPVDERPTWQALQKRWELFAETLHHHHSGEDAALWPLLIERGDETEVETLEAMEAEHAEIDPILTACRAGFARMVDAPDEDTRAALAVRLAAARESLGRHLAHEEGDAMAIVQRRMTDQEWRDLEEEAFASRYSFADRLRLLPWLCHRVPDEIRIELFGRTGGPFPFLWRLLRPGFERRERRAFRHL